MQPVIVQSMHAPPIADPCPHAVGAVPGMQTPAALQQPLPEHPFVITHAPFSRSQHPILHGEVALHVDPQTLFTHACWFPQSIAMVHSTQEPAAEQAGVVPLHITHAPPPIPHCAGPVLA
jgi:hypothetical protein